MSSHREAETESSARTTAARMLRDLSTHRTTTSHYQRKELQSRIAVTVATGEFEVVDGIEVVAWEADQGIAAEEGARAEHWRAKHWCWRTKDWRQHHAGAGHDWAGHNRTGHDRRYDDRAADHGAPTHIGADGDVAVVSRSREFAPKRWADQASKGQEGTRPC
jgi:hypothetical protein